MPPMTTPANDDCSGDSNRYLTFGGVRILRQLRGSGHDATIQLDSSATTNTAAEQEAETIRQLVIGGYLETAGTVSHEFRITHAGITALDAFETEWQERLKGIYNRPFSLLGNSGFVNSIKNFAPLMSTASGTVSPFEASFPGKSLPIIEEISSSSRIPNGWANQFHVFSGLWESFREINKIAVRSVPKVGFDLSSIHYGWRCLIFDPEEYSVPEFLATTGIPLAGATPPHVSQALIDADPDYQESVLLDHRADIFTQCRYVLDQGHADQTTVVTLVRDALDLLEAGHFAGAQALASCALDAIGERVVAQAIEKELIPRPEDFDDTRYGVYARALLRFPDPGVPNSLKSREVVFPTVAERYQPTLKDFRWAITIPVLLSAYAPTPEVYPGGPYSRHATVHPSDSSHFNESNAMRAVMTVISLLWVLTPTKALSSS